MVGLMGMVLLNTISVYQVAWAKSMRSLSILDTLVLVRDMVMV